MAREALLARDTLARRVAARAAGHAFEVGVHRRELPRGELRCRRPGAGREEKRGHRGHSQKTHAYPVAILTAMCTNMKMIMRYANGL